MRKLIYAAPIMLTLLGCEADNLAAQKAAAALPGCGETFSTSNVVDQINTSVSLNPTLKMIAGGVRASSLSEVKELHSDEGMRACEATIRRSNGTEGSVGYVITWLRRDARLAMVQIENLGQLRETYVRTAVAPAPTAPTPAPTPAASTPPAEAKREEPRLTEIYDRCMEGSSSKPEMLECAEEEVSRQRASLQAALASAKGDVAKEQDGWEKSVTQECTGEDPQGGLVCEALAIAKRREVVALSR